MQITCGVHWLTATVWTADTSKVAAVIGQLLYPNAWLGLENWIQRGGSRMFRTRFELPGHAVCLYCDPIEEGQGVYVSLDIAGEVCERLGSAGLRKLMDALGELGRVRYSRIDLAADGLPIEVEWVEEQAEAGNLRSRIKRDGESEWLTATRSRVGQLVKATVMLGSTKSEKRLRVYDRRETGVRAELQARGDAAAAAGIALAALPVESWPELIRGAIGEFVSFVDASADPNISRCPLLPEWAAFLAGALRVSLALPKGFPSFDKAEAWLATSVMPTLAAVIRAWGPTGRQWLYDSLREGEKRWGPRQRAILADAGAI